MTYVVQPGDSLWSIAAQFGVTVQAIAAANRIANPHVLFAGQTLHIPHSGSPANPASGNTAINGRLDKLEREFAQAVTILDHHRQQIADLERRVQRLER